ncbi:DUF4962 domain-containing protein [Nocardioides nitrophenolicus]|uniref:DUF4962 domain-containing protein n=1 Tax=Nocardioides nitrophenolicus TaxID=60489 RepID=UPI00195EE09F|nr:DUF4962 domain-containing protein [Nocardioides nitrophenolicus]MBM7515404.1 hypothetical protein [Nocardioides nitrophenolicus]
MPLPAPLTRLAVAGALALTGVLVATPTATAALDAPTQVTADISAGSAQISWNRVAGATGYQVQVDDNEDFSSTLVSVTTVNDSYVTPSQMPVGTLYVRVQATGGPWSATVSQQRGILAAPSAPLPASGTTLTAGSAPSLTWNAVAGASSYQVRIATTDSSECETAQVKTGGWTSESTRFVLRDRVLAPGQPYYWCVRATLPNSVFSEWTSPRLFDLANLGAPALVSPGNGATSLNGDVTLDWDPKPGAATYQVQVGWDEQFSTGVRVDTTITATRWSPNPNVLDNRTWYWRVRAKDANGNPHHWSNVRHFVRSWTDQPVLQWPLDDAAEPTADMYYEWRAVRRADYYTLQTAWDADFTIGRKECRSSHTTYVGECGGNPNGWTYWRVLANEDDTLGINASGNTYTHTTQTEVGSAQVRRYQSVIARPTKVSPAANATLAAGQVPTLTWNPVTFAATYQVKITNLGNGDEITKTTATTAFTPRALLDPGTYAWDVVPRTIDGVAIGYLELSAQRRFTVSAYAADGPVAGAPALLTDGVDGYRAPTLAWQPVTGATKYVVRVRPQGDSAWQQISDTFAYPAGQDNTTSFAAPGTYEWKVLPSAGSTPLAESSVGTFTVKPLYDPDAPTAMSYGDWLAGTEITAALSGNTMYGNAGDTADRCELTTATTGCTDLRQTPILRWRPRDTAAENPNIAFYKLSLYADQARTTTVPGYKDIVVRRHAWMPVVPLADAQAGQAGSTSAYWVQLIPCGYTACATAASVDPTINAPLAHAFNKSYDKAVTVSPTNGATVPITDTAAANDLVFEWKDMLEAQAQALPGGTSLGNSHADTEAVKYQLSYSRLENFSNAVTVSVDHTYYTPPAPLSDGDVYWKVRAIDDDGKPLNWSDTAQFTITSPTTTGLTPSAAASTVSGRQALTWDYAPYAPTYVLEVYAGGIPQGTSTTDRKVRETVYGTSWTPTSSLLTAGLYTWRVRGIDANDNQMRWSEWAQFTVSPDSPAQNLPAAGANIAPQDLLMSWGPVEGASQYKVEWRVANSTTVSSQTTTGLAWAPTGALGTAGTWEWRVTGYRGSTPWGSATAWRTFQVALKPTATTAVSIPTSSTVGAPLTLTPPVWDFGDVADTTYQWFRGSTAIPGATGKTYVVTADDFGKALKVVATLQVAGYQDGVSTSGTVTPGAVAAPSVVTAPVVGGDPRVGGSLSVTTGAVWSNGATTTYQWLRDGKTISGKTGETYAVQSADAGHTVSVRATGRLAGHADGVTESNRVSVAPAANTKVSTSTTLTRSAAKLRRGKKVTLTAVVTAAGRTGLGTVTIEIVIPRKSGVKTKTITLNGANTGVTKIKLKVKGKYKFRAVYKGMTNTTGSSSAWVTVKAR